MQSFCRLNDRNGLSLNCLKKGKMSKISQAALKTQIKSIAVLQEEKALADLQCQGFSRWAMILYRLVK